MSGQPHRNFAVRKFLGFAARRELKAEVFGLGQRDQLGLEDRAPHQRGAAFEGTAPSQIKPQSVLSDSDLVDRARPSRPRPRIRGKGAADCKSLLSGARKLNVRFLTC
jgi:hypothetical protein